VDQQSTTPLRYAVQGGKYLERRKVKKPDCYQEAGGRVLHLSGTVQGGKYLKRRKVKKPDRYQEEGGSAECYTSQVQYKMYCTVSPTDESVHRLTMATFLRTS
jgi:hypothetical protein